MCNRCKPIQLLLQCCSYASVSTLVSALDTVWMPLAHQVNAKLKPSKVKTPATLKPSKVET